MTTTERIVHHLQSLSETRRLEVLDFVEFIKSRSRAENAVWSELSLASAMRGWKKKKAFIRWKISKSRRNGAGGTDRSICISADRSRSWQIASRTRREVSAK
jgi:hypothetical protein